MQSFVVLGSWSRDTSRLLAGGLGLDGCGVGLGILLATVVLTLALVLRSVAHGLVSKSHLESTFHNISSVLPCLTDYWKHVSNSK